jgi:hypothetical protein
MHKVNKYGEAMRNLAQSMRNIPESQRPNINASNMSLDQYANALNSNPQIRDAIRRANMTPKDFAYTMFALLSASMASSIIQMRPNDNADSLAREMQANPKNIRFVREHEAEIKQMQEEMSKLEQ